MHISDKLKKTISEKLKEDPKAMIFKLAQELSVPEQAVVECLPEEEVRKADAHHFDEVMAMIATWGNVTTILQTESVVLEAKGMIPMGSYGHGYFNLMGGRDYNVGGHIRADLLSAIYFVERPFMGLQSMSVQFFTLSGAPMFKVYLGRDEKRQLLPDQIEHFKTLRDRITSTNSCACCA